MPAIITSTTDSVCAKCMAEVESYCLKCSRCSTSMHLRCSELPLYMLLRYKTSQAGFVCEKCVPVEGDESSLEEEKRLLEEVMTKEIQTIKDAANEAEKSLNEVVDMTPEGKESKIEISSKGDKKPVCKFYIKGTCKHGKKATTMNMIIQGTPMSPMLK